MSKKILTLIFFVFFYNSLLFGNSFINEFSEIYKTTKNVSLGGQVTSDFNNIDGIGTSNPATIFKKDSYLFLTYFNNNVLYDYNLFVFSFLLPFTEVLNVGIKINTLVIENILATKDAIEIIPRNINFSTLDISGSYQLFDYLYIGLGTTLFISSEDIILDKLLRFDLGVLFILSDILFEEELKKDFIKIGLGIKNVDSLFNDNPFIRGDFHINTGISISLKEFIQQPIKVFLEFTSIESFSFGTEGILFEIVSLRGSINLPYGFFIGQVSEHISFNFGGEVKFNSIIGFVKHELNIIPSYAFQFKSSNIENFFQVIIEFIPGDEKLEEEPNLENVFD